MADLITKMSSRGQITIPAKLRTALGLEPGTRFLVREDEHGQLILAKIPGRSDWEKLMADIPTEKVELDENGHYDPKKSPHFDEWMREG